MKNSLKQLVYTSLVAGLALSFSLTPVARAIDTTNTDGHQVTLNVTEIYQDLVPVRQNVVGDERTFYLINDMKTETDRVLPVVHSPDGQNVSFAIQNPTDQVYYLSIPDQDVKFYVPIQSERTAIVDVARVQRGTSIPYYLLNQDGEKVATGYVVNGEIPQRNLTAATAEQHAQWSRELNMLIQANEYHPPKFAAKPEPKYYNDAGTFSNVNTGGTVRGYW